MQIKLKLSTEGINVLRVGLHRLEQLPRTRSRRIGDLRSAVRTMLKWAMPAEASSDDQRPLEPEISQAAIGELDAWMRQLRKTPEGAEHESSIDQSH